MHVLLLDTERNEQFDGLKNIFVCPIFFYHSYFDGHMAFGNNKWTVLIDFDPLEI